MEIHEEQIKKLEEMANTMRQDLIEMLLKAGSGHTAGPLGMADIFCAFYFHILNHKPENPFWEERDRLILSNGHICPIRYVAMARSGYFPVAELATLRKFGTRLQGHPEREKLPGVETTSGPLGSGLGQAAGIAYAALMDTHSTGSGQAKKFKVYCLMSDGEQDAGNIWESAMFAGKNKLHNLIAVMDRNNIQITGMTEDIMPLESLRAKYEAFNWHVIEVNGNNISEFINAIEEAKAIFEKPTIIIAHTIPGKGIKEIEFDFNWHGKAPNKEEAKKFLHELRTIGGKIKSEHE
ncbi:MAG: transketolase [Candidatus Staskawiczbacteria bacterium RIFCSPHIGHO2_02_FULL_34_10]|uniref:Transketolase n=1 Tax=Candidatus Staskawiczbacteria bacterium RIFCSPHIGHO2_02_FULL_34_10 TaxID=1802205 RepID=A0A1G2HWL3_9BACT|nr:MAG: transketolase [Candidatus Staskawiczbacteria bacterium RIFCSPHIGHO2_02_FULL_34_10]